MRKALWLAGEIETNCHQYWAALLAGKPVLLDDGQMASVLKRFKSYGKQAKDLEGVDPAQLAVMMPVKRGDATEESSPKTDKKKPEKKKKAKVF